MSDVGTGITVVFGTSAFSAELLSIDGSGISRESYETTDMGTTGSKTFAPTKLVDQGSLDIEIAFDPNNEPPVDGATETITITFPLPTGDTTAATLVGSGFMTDFSFNAALEEKMTASATIKWAGGLTWTDSA